MPDALLGVSSSALSALMERLKRGALSFSCLGGDDVTASSAKSAWVTFENLIAGGGSSSESLSSPTSMRFIIGASAEKPCEEWKADSGEFRLICGRVGWATAAIIRLTVPLTQSLFLCVSLWCAIPKVPRCLPVGVLFVSVVVSECT